MPSRCYATLLVAALALFGCAVEDELPDSCEVDLTAYERGAWPPPATPKLYHSLPPPDDVSQFFRFEFTPALPESLNTVWWPVDTDVTMRLSASTGTKRRDTTDAALMLFLDGRQIPMNTDAGSVVQAPFQLLPGSTGSMTVVVPGASIPGGTHTLVAAALDRRTGAITLAETFTLIRAREPFVARPDHTALSQIVPGEEFETPPASGGVVLDRRRPLRLGADGLLPLSLHLQVAHGTACRSMPSHLVASVLIDGVQAELDGIGPFVRVLVPYGKQAIIDLGVRGVPQDGSAHVITVMKYDSDGVYSEAPLGSFAAWAAVPPLSIGEDLVETAAAP